MYGRVVVGFGVGQEVMSQSVTELGGLEIRVRADANMDAITRCHTLVNTRVRAVTWVLYVTRYRV